MLSAEPANNSLKQSQYPDDLYDRPANDFVMRFLGPVTQLRGDLVRPHDLELHAVDPGSGVEGVITRVTRVGFEVRVDVSAGGQSVLVTLTRTEFQALQVEQGSTVFLRVAFGAPVVPAGGGAADLDIVPV